MAGQQAEALRMAREALALREQTLGPRAPSVGRALNLTAQIARATDLLDTSGVVRQSYDRAIAILSTGDTVDHRELAQAYRGLSTITMDQEKPKEALSLIQRAVAEARLAVGPDHPYLFNITESAALAYQANGMPDTAIAMHRQLLAARARVFGTAHPDYAFSLYNLGRELCRVKQFDEGLPLLVQAIAVREQALGAEHYLVGYGLISYATALASSGALDTAARSFSRAAAVLGASLGPTALARQDALEGLAKTRAMLKQRDATLSALESLVASGYKQPDVLTQEPFVAYAREPRLQAVLAKMKQ